MLKILYKYKPMIEVNYFFKKGLFSLIAFKKIKRQKNFFNVKMIKIITSYIDFYSTYTESCSSKKISSVFLRPLSVVILKFESFIKKMLDLILLYFYQTKHQKSPLKRLFRFFFTVV